MKTLLIQIAKNIHGMCTKIDDCDECMLYVKNNGICPYEYTFGTMPMDWVFGGDENDKLR